MVIQALFEIAKHVLGIVATEQSRKYLDRTIELEKLYYAEQSKPEDKRNHALMDNIINELCIISKAATTFGKEGVKN